MNILRLTRARAQARRRGRRRALRRHGRGIFPRVGNVRDRDEQARRRDGPAGESLLAEANTPSRSRAFFRRRKYGAAPAPVPRRFDVGEGRHEVREGHITCAFIFLSDPRPRHLGARAHAGWGAGAPVARRRARRPKLGPLAASRGRRGSPASKRPRRLQYSRDRLFWFTSRAGQQGIVTSTRQS